MHLILLPVPKEAPMMTVRRRLVLPLLGMSHCVEYLALGTMDEQLASVFLFLGTGIKSSLTDIAMALSTLELTWLLLWRATVVMRSPTKTS